MKNATVAGDLLVYMQRKSRMRARRAAEQRFRALGVHREDQCSVERNTAFLRAVVRRTER